jgi:hypothetical protein
MDNNFTIKRGYNSVIFEKDGTIFSVEKGPDNDIWFNSANGNITLPISFYSINQEEWQTYVIFENLMKSIVGRYVLYDDKYVILPTDFIDLESKTITWYSDSEEDNKLQLQFREKEIIVSITSDDNTYDRTYNNAIKVRIRTSGSSYEYYYQEFERFFDELYSFNYKVKSMSKSEIPTYETKSTIQRKLSLFNKFKK